MTTSAHDWLSAVRAGRAAEGEVLRWCDLRPGDRLQVKTRNTLYEFRWGGEGDGEAELRTDRLDRPAGRVQLHGCAYGAGSTIAPDRLFNGGNLEYTSAGGRRIHRTTAIAWIRLLRHF